MNEKKIERVMQAIAATKGHRAQATAAIIAMTEPEDFPHHLTFGLASLPDDAIVGTIDGEPFTVKAMKDLFPGGKLLLLIA